MGLGVWEHSHPGKSDCRLNPGERGKVIKKLWVPGVGPGPCAVHLSSPPAGWREGILGLGKKFPEGLSAVRLPGLPEEGPESTGQQDQLWSDSQFTLPGKEEQEIQSPNRCLCVHFHVHFLPPRLIFIRPVSLLSY